MNTRPIGTTVNTDDLVTDIARARDAATGDMKRLLKRAGRRIEKLEVVMHSIAEYATATAGEGAIGEDER